MMTSPGADGDAPRSYRSGLTLPPISPQADQTGSSLYRGVLGSSIDLVQSYRRSQAFIGENLPSSLSHSNIGSLYRGHRRRHRSGDQLEDGTESSISSLGFTDQDELEQDDDELNEYDLATGPPIQPDSASALGRGSPVSHVHHPHLRRFWNRRPSTLFRATRQSVGSGGLPSVAAPTSPSSVGNNRDQRILGDASASETSQLLRSPYFNRRYQAISSEGSIASSPLPGVSSAAESQTSLSAALSSSSTLPQVYGSSAIPCGTSTFGQTLFNAFNVLCGVGLLSEPLAFASAGWIGSVFLFMFCGLSTNYTAKLLVRMMAEDRALLTYNDICFKAFGRSMRYPIACLFCLELFALSVALVVIFGDSFATLFPTISSISFKLLAFCLVLPTVFMPFQVLSYASLIGLASSVTLVAVVVIDGLLKPDSPGSIFHPAPTSLGPGSKWGLSAGLMMSGFSGHSVIPSLARDMSTPQDFNRMIDYAYFSAGSMYLLTGIMGYLMFGENVSQEITQDILGTVGFPVTINQLALWMVGINPLAKFALSTRPLNLTIEHILNLSPTALSSDPHAPPPQEVASVSSAHQQSPAKKITSHHSRLRSDSTQTSRNPCYLTETILARITKVFGKIVSRTLVTALVILVAILIPQFERVMSFLGAFSAFVISIILPISAELVLKPEDSMSKASKLINIALLVSSIIMAAVGTTFSFL